MPVIRAGRAILINTSQTVVYSACYVLIMSNIAADTSFSRD